MSTRLAQVLEITPKNELVFTGPFTEVSTVYLTLHNPTEHYIAFKVKTTAPNYYCVRPNSGLINPNTSKEVAVMLQPLENTSTLEQDKAKHKFMIQSAYASENENLSNFWKSTSTDNIMDSKLKVKFTPSEKSEIANRITSSLVNYQSASTNNVNSEGTNNPTNITDSTNDQMVVKLKSDIANLEKKSKGQMEQIALLKQCIAEYEIKGESSNKYEGLPNAQVALFCLLTFIIGIILGKLF
uniref:Major sperm protein n=1 Tax=Parastrongyloides trichosuri TaxID=131310 RepID=A0A0N4ZNC5_PARTI